MEYYVGLDGQKQGPFPADRINQMRTAGRITAETLVWKNGADRWKPLWEFSEIAGDSTPPLPQASGIPPLPPQGAPSAPLPPQPSSPVLKWGGVIAAIVSPLACYVMEANAAATVGNLTASGATSLQELANQSDSTTNTMLTEATGAWMIITFASVIAGIIFAIWGKKTLGFKSPWVTVPAIIQAIVILILGIGWLN